MANIVELTDRFPVNNKTIKVGKTVIEIKGYVPADTYAEIVNTIANSSFDEGGKYHPEYREIAKRYVIIKHMTDIELGGINAAELFQATQGGTWYGLIEAEINKLPIWAELEQAVDEDRKLIAFSVVFSAAVGLVMALIAPLVPRMYNTTPLVRQLAAGMILINAIMMPANAFTNASFFTLRSGGKSFITFLYDSVYIWILAIPVTLCLVTFTNLPVIPI